MRLRRSETTRRLAGIFGSPRHACYWIEDSKITGDAGMHSSNSINVLKFIFTFKFLRFWTSWNRKCFPSKKLGVKCSSHKTVTCLLKGLITNKTSKITSSVEGKRNQRVLKLTSLSKKYSCGIRKRFLSANIQTFSRDCKNSKSSIAYW